MKFTAKLSVIRGVLGTGIFIPCPKDTELKDDVEYEINICKPRKKRSLTANAYCWILCQKIAERLTIGGTYTSKEDVYRKAIKDCGHFTPVPVRHDIVPIFCRNWEHNGIGWVTEDMGPCKRTKGYELIALYHGSSVYNAEEMARLIDCLVDDAKQIGVETRPQWEVDALLQEWGEADEAESG